MRTYVKIEGKDIESIVQKLAKLAVDLPEICVWDYNMLNAGWGIPLRDGVISGEMADYFEMDTGAFEKECDKIVVKSEADLGNDNMYFEWQTPPSDEQLRKLRNMIDGIIKPFGNKYTVTNRK